MRNAHLVTNVEQNPPPLQGVPSESMVKLQVLLDGQANTMRQLVESEARRATLQREVQRTTGAEQQHAREELLQYEQNVQEYRATLTGIREEIAALQLAVPPTPPPSFPMLMEPERIFGYSKPEFIGLTSMMVLLPLVVAFAVRIARRSVRPASSPAVLESERFTRLEQAVESIAIEVERIGESQRFTSRVLTERAAPSVAPRFKPSVTPV